MESKRQYEQIVTDQLTEADWTAVLALNLPLIYLAYLAIFRDNSDRAMSYEEVISLLKESGVILSRDDKISFNKINEVLKNTKTAYRVRAISKDEHRFHMYRIVKVGPAQKRFLEDS